MAWKIIWTETSIRDLREILRYIAIDDSGAAERFGNLIIEKIEKIGAFPNSARIVPEKRDEKVREIILSPYRIIFEIDIEKKVLYVVRIWHAARGIPDL